MKKILVIEDEANIALVVKIILEDEGYIVNILSEATHFKNAVTESHTDLILLDLNIAGFDGQTICDYIKSHSDLKTIPVILMSANPNIKDVKKECGAEDIIAKPFDINDLIDIVRAYA